MRRFLLAMLLAIYLVVLFALALRPSTANVQLVNLVPFSSIVQGLRAGGPLFVINIVGNIVVFVPLGIVLPNLDRRFQHWIKTLIIGIALSATIEALQWTSAQRVADVDDLLLNGFGTWIGYRMYAALQRR